MFEENIMMQQSTYETENANKEDNKIDNSEMSFSGRNICILLNDNENDKKNRLKTSENALVRRFPKLKELSSVDRMQ